jgi:hypothetical protein
VYGLKALFEAGEAGRTVVLELRRDYKVFAFVPRKAADGKVEYDAWWCGASHFRQELCAALKNGDTCFIIDMAAEDTKRRAVTAAQRIMVSCPDPGNFDNMLKEAAG